MTTNLDRLMLLLILSDLGLLGIGRLGPALGLLAFQGVLLSGLVLAAHAGALGLRLVILATASLAVRAVLFPWLLRRAGRQAGITRELNPFVGYAPSLLLGIAMLGGAMALGERLPLALTVPSQYVLPASLFTVFTGLFLVVARRKALTQCLGYLVLENGIYAFGVAAVGEVPALIELGALLDLFVAVLVMGVAMYRISEEFDHMDTDRLDTLRG
jgi:hydrogenase-4 component E